MSIAVKVFAFFALLCVVSALPMQDAEQLDGPQIDLMAADSSPMTDSSMPGEAVRDKRTIGLLLNGLKGHGSYGYSSYHYPSYRYVYPSYVYPSYSYGYPHHGFFG